MQIAIGIGVGVGGGVVTPDPSSIVTDGTVKLWLRSRGPITTVSGVDLNITQWDDRSGSGFHATQSTSGTRPEKSDTAFNGRPCAVFTRANNDHLRCDAVAAVLQGTNTPFSMGIAISVASLGVDTNIFRVLRNASSNPILALTIDTSNRLVLTRRNDAASVTTSLVSTQTIDTADHWLWHDFDGTSSWLYIDNVVTSISGTAAAAGALTLDRVGIGNNPITPTLGLGGEVGEFLLMSRVSSGAAERLALYNYYRSEFGI